MDERGCRPARGSSVHRERNQELPGKARL